MRYVLQIGYDGTAFSGSQRQPGARTVQGVVEGAAADIFGVTTAVAFSGRTDAGVHAAGQICHLDGQTSVPPHKLREVFNRLLPPDVRVLASAAAPAGFDCTRGAKKKTYCYRMYAAPAAHPLLDRYAVRVTPPPDLNAMRSAARLTVGEHDFAAFRASGSSAKTSVRTLYAVDISQKSVWGMPMWELRVTGNGFLYNMVRILAGELCAIGQGRAEERSLTEAFIVKERALLDKTMPARGLILERVDYGLLLFEEEAQ